MKAVLRCSTLFLIVGLVAALPAWALDYTYSNIQVPGSNTTSAVGINNKGDVVGYYQDSMGRIHGFILSKGSYTTLDYPGAIGGTFAAGINDAGVVVGSYDNGQIVAGFVYANGTFAQLRYHKSATFPASINKAGDIVGSYSVNNTYRGFEWSNGKFKTFAPPHSTGTFPAGINTAGSISGTFYDASGQHGFLLRNGTYGTIDVPGSNNTTNAAGLNDKDYVVGNYEDPTRQSHEGFLMMGSKFRELIAPGSVTTFPSDINNHNVVVGVYFNGGVNPVAFMAKPK